jgi:hypothetical protein
LPPGRLGAEDRRSLETALREAETALRARPDDHASHYNLGNLHLAKGDPEKAVAEYSIS